MEVEEIVKILIAIVLLIALVGVVIVLLKGKGGDLLGSIRNILRFGKIEFLTKKCKLESGCSRQNV